MPSSALNEASDRILAGRAGDGDIRAFEILIHRYSPLLRSYARHLLGSSDESDDTVQQTFITAWQQLPTLVDPGAVKPWLMRILNRKCLDRIRARKLTENIDDNEILAVDPTVDPELVAEDHAFNSALTAALLTLPENQRRCWLMKEIAEYSYVDIANELNLPASTIRGLLARARMTLIREMGPWR
ncbi:RNA polymerase sigma factor [Leifsonia sp. A12D58]|uniref:RNA polymerase sigma factor n=1 Tax=Leifsonia sp. A12D58 TaxID=3397674 RepID=UPI0039E10471